MRTSLLIIAALFLGAFGAHFLMEDRGYVLFRFLGYSIETSVPVLVLGLILLYVLTRLAMRLLQAPRNIGRAAGAYRARRARNALTQGLTQISAGNWAEAEKLLAREAHRSDAPALHYISAAKAAALQGADSRRDNWLKLAHDQGDDSRPAVLLTEAELRIADEDYPAALDALRRLEVAKPGHRQGLALQAQVLESTGDWTGLRALLPALNRHQALPAEDLTGLEQRVLGRVFQDAGADGNAEAVRANWRGLSRKQRKNAYLHRAYIRGLSAAGEHAEAEKELRTELKARWDDEMVLLYGELKHDPARTLKQVEKWLGQRSNDPVLLLSAGRQAMLNELWGKARSYLETSISLDPRVDSYQLYGRLLNETGEKDAAVIAFRSGLALATGDVASDLPALGAPDDGLAPDHVPGETPPSAEDTSADEPAASDEAPAEPAEKSEEVSR